MFSKKPARILPRFASSFLPIIIAVLLTACGSGGGGGNTDPGTTNNINESNSIGPNGGTVTSSNGKAKIVLPAGALSQDAGITVAVVSNQPSGNIGTAYEFGQDGTTFNKPVTISITYDDASLPSGVSESDIKLGMITNNQWQEITNSVVDTVANIVSGTTSHLSIYGVIAVSNSGTEPAAPAGVVASAGDGNVNISWNDVSKTTSYNIYWATTSGVSKTSYTGKITGAISPYPHTGLINGTTYYYVVTTVNSYGESSESSQVSATPVSTVFPDTTAPLNTTASNFINSGAASTNLTNVTLSISATDIVGVTGYYLSETSGTPSASAAGWVAVTSVTSYTTNVSFSLSSGDGPKTLYVWFKDAAGNVSPSKSDTITLQNTIPKADAGPDQIVGEDNVVTLNGSGSSDPDGDPLTYQWTFNSIPYGSSAKLTFANIASPSFIPDIEGDYVAQLIVNDGKDNSPPDEVRVTAIKSKKITLKSSINTKVVYGKVHYLGQMINETDYPACFIEITIDSMDAQNKLIDTDYTYIDGSTMVVSGTIYTDTCLRSGEIGGFEIYTDLAEIPAKFVHVINSSSSAVSEPIILPSQVIIDGQIIETTDYSGNLELMGFIKNLHPNITLQFVEISFVALNGDKVVDTDYTYINGSSCTLIYGGTTDTCLAPGESRSFSVTLDVPPSEVTDYYYKINFVINK